MVLPLIVAAPVWCLSLHVIDHRRSSATRCTVQAAAYNSVQLACFSLFCWTSVSGMTSSYKAPTGAYSLPLHFCFWHCVLQQTAARLCTALASAGGKPNKVRMDVVAGVVL